MPNLQKFRDYHYEATSKVTDGTRTLALAGIAIVWIFKKEVDGHYQVPAELICPLFLVALSLALDYLQHVFRSAVWHWQYRKQEAELEAKRITEHTELYASPWINFASYSFFYSKAAVLALAYWFILGYFFGAVQWV